MKDLKQQFEEVFGKGSVEELPELYKLSLGTLGALNHLQFLQFNKQRNYDKEHNDNNQPFKKEEKNNE